MPDVKIPDWMQPAIPVTDADRHRLDPIRRSWLSLSPKLPTMTEIDLIKVILLECSDQKRPVIISRCVSRFRSKRITREDRELFNVDAPLLSLVISARARRA